MAVMRAGGQFRASVRLRQHGAGGQRHAAVRVEHGGRQDGASRQRQRLGQRRRHGSTEPGSSVKLDSVTP